LAATEFRARPLPGDLYLAQYGARYLDDTFAASDEFRGLTLMCESAFERLDRELEELRQETAAAEQRESQRTAEASTTDAKKGNEMTSATPDEAYAILHVRPAGLMP
jgi:hypothetical protein